jgi:hypothetical protein
MQVPAASPASSLKNGKNSKKKYKLRSRLQFHGQFGLKRLNSRTRTTRTTCINAGETSTPAHTNRPTSRPTFEQFIEQGIIYNLIKIARHFTENY